jgi:predicted HicB family RNase H-like nuclease
MMNYLKYKGYTGSVEFSAADDCLHGKVLGMTKDSITYEGETVSELKTDFQNAVDSYIEGCQELGITPRKPYNGVLNIRIPSEIHEKAALLAMQQGMTVNALIRDAITKRVGHVTDSRNINRT